MATSLSLVPSHEIQTNSFDWDSVVSLDSAQAAKIVSVALASLVFFSFQLSFPLAIGCGLALAFSTVTYLSEKLIRTEPEQKNNWFSLENVDKDRLFLEVTIRLVAIPIIFGLAYSLTGFAPVQKVAELILSGDLKIILLATTIAPIVEEIFFRGFLQERFEDIGSLVNRYIYPLSWEDQKAIANIAQGFIFGYVHIIGDQVKRWSGKVAVFISASVYGLYFGALKSNEGSLFSPIALHSSGNTGFTLGLLLFGRK